MVAPLTLGKVPKLIVTRIANRCREDCEEIEQIFGVKFEPRSEPIEGSACPDREKFAYDYRRIYSGAQAMGGEMGAQLKIHNDAIMKLAPNLNPMA